MKSATQIAHRQQLQHHQYAIRQRVQIEAEYPPLKATISMENLIVWLLVWRDLPFTFATSQESHDILFAVRPEAAKLLPSSSNTIKSWIFVCFQCQKFLLKNFCNAGLPQDIGKVMTTLSNRWILLHRKPRGKMSITHIVVMLSRRFLLKVLCNRFH